MASVGYSFDGGVMLNRMGSSWFVSYAYYQHCDKSHKNWDKVKTSPMRISYYNKGRQYHKEWLKQVLSMDDARLANNTIDLSPLEIKKMARAILAKMS